MLKARPGRRLRPAFVVIMAVVLLLGATALLVPGCGGGKTMGNGNGANGSGGVGGNPGAGVKITWYGHSAFLITSPDGVRVLTDPYPGNLGYGNRRFKADVVTVSHEHFDHNSVASVEDEPDVFRGLSADDWAKVDQTVKDVHIVSIGGTYHDDQRGTKRGKNSFFLIETGGLRILHLGDLGEIPAKDTVDQAGRVDVLLIPVGGFFTVDAATATEVADLFAPKVIIPMHYRTPAIASWQITDERPFIEGKSGAKRVEASEVTLSPETLPSKTEIWVLRPGS